MKKGVIILIIVIVILIGIIILGLSMKQTYKPFTLERQGTTAKMCENYYEECNCYGRLLVMESYPMQYQCNGFKSCKDIDETVCDE
jgi:hypothetical protein|tara:strand:- start:245 stop:502 length:258 start_codon:yes stop_codon:yes gene_type:complete